MPVSAALKRLLRIRELEEELSKSALENAVAEREHFRRGRQSVADRLDHGRRLWEESVSAAESENRHAALEEISIGTRLTDFASAKLAEAETLLGQRRESYLATRMLRRQAETLIEEAQHKDAQTALRRTQQDLDEWFRSDAKSGDEGNAKQS